MTYDPDRVVALGAALYAHYVSTGEINTKVSDVTKALSIGLYDGTVSNIIPGNSKIPLSMEKMFTNPVKASSLEIDLYQGESMFAKDNSKIGTLVWDFDEPVEAHCGQVIVEISVDTMGVIKFSARELLKAPKTIVLERS